MELVHILISLLFMLGHFSYCQGERLNEFIRDYEPVVTDPGEVRRVRRSLEDPSEAGVTMNLQGFGKNFRLRLRPDTKIFTSDAVIERSDGKKIDFDRNAMLVGEVDGDAKSFVHGSLVNGHFEGTIGTENEMFYVEPASKFLENPGYDTIMYKASDVEYEYKYPDITRRMPQPNVNEEELKESHKPRRAKRATTEEMKRAYCTLYIGADITFTEKFEDDYPRIIAEIIDHYQAANIIYLKDFNKPDYYSGYGLGFRIKKIEIFNKARPNPPNAKLLAENNVGVDTYLDEFSKVDSSQYCAAFMFTNRDFDGGILGLAWIGYPSGQAGGICMKYLTFSKGKRSYNTGLVTFSLYRKFVPRRVSEITFAHELGHSFGSQHDPDDNKECVPGADPGNYIMYASATSGNKANNNIFSKCSLDMIKKNVDAKRSSYSYRSCFITEQEPICGNRVVEKGEECDCGDKQTCTEKCCEPAGNANQCKLKLGFGYNCSPSQGPCCSNETCRYSDDVCRPDGDCTFKTMCIASQANAKCPLPAAKPNKTSCMANSRVCISGQCTGSICLKHDHVECPCSEKQGLCKICCKDPKGGQCKLITEISAVPEDTKSAGTSCDNMKGYCDAFAVCRRINMDGPLKRLFSKVLSVEGIKELTAEYWWAILLGVIGFIVMVAFMVKICADFTPSSNPVKEAKKPHKPLRKKKNAASGTPGMQMA